MALERSANAARREADRRIGVVGIVVTDREQSAGHVQDILTEFGDVVVGRMGVPYRERGVSVIALIVDGDTDRLGALTGRLGSLPGVHARSALTAYVGETAAKDRQESPRGVVERTPSGSAQKSTQGRGVGR